MPKPPDLRDSFDLYVDALENVPDNATIVKVHICLRVYSEWLEPIPR